MDEPVLTGRGNPGHWRRRFRVLIVSERGGSALRVDFSPDGKGAARETVVEGPRRHVRYSIERQQVLDMEPEVALAVAAAIDESGLSELASVVPSSNAAAEGLEEEGVEGPICMPLAYLLFELVEAGRSRLVWRSGCDMTPELRRLLDRLYQLIPPAPAS